MSGKNKLPSPEELLRDLKFLSDQLCIIEHEQDDEGIAAIRKKYKIKRLWEE